MPLDLSDADKAALVALLKATIAADRFSLSPRVRALRRILDKLEPPGPSPQPIPAPKPPGEPSLALRRKQRRR